MTPFELVLVGFAVLYSSEVLATKKGPFGICERIRERFPLGGLTNCVWCLWPYFSIMFLVIYRWIPILVYPFAIAGAVAAVHAYTGVKHDA
jgi:hypothetical protein